MKKPDFLHFDTDSLKLKVGVKDIGVGMVKKRCGHSGLRTLNLTVSQEEINGRN